MKIRSLLVVFAMMMSASLASHVVAQDANKTEADDVSSLFASMESSASPSTSSDRVGAPMTTAELRMARAQYRSSQRIARLESNLWMGYEPLRPTWSSTPMTSSRYAPVRTYFVPVYYYGR